MPMRSEKIAALFPQLELCKLIPKGNFMQANWRWEKKADANGNIDFSIASNYLTTKALAGFDLGDNFPAPTAQELITQLSSEMQDAYIRVDEDCGCVEYVASGWCYNDGRRNRMENRGDTMADALLRLWLTVHQVGTKHEMSKEKPESEEK